MPSEEYKSVSPVTTSTTTSEKKDAKARKGNDVLSFIQTLVTIGILVFLIRGTLIEPFKIPSGSMIPTLQIHDHILVSKLSYGFRLPFVTNTLYMWSTPNRGDVVVFTRPDDPATREDDSDPNLIKRVIGLPGDSIEVRGAQVFINGQPYDEPYARWVDGGRPDGNFGPKTVPEGHILLLGDNRDQSKDSRYWSDPFLDIRRVKGRALVIYFSPQFFSRFGKLIR
jgi:signal peptidase I